MRAFISHEFTEPDILLATRLGDILRKGGDTGYLAEKHLEYNLMIHEKLKSAIDASDYLVAIITRDGQSSPSVHEEIGYALGRDIRVLIMLERGVEMKGVFAHGKEPEVFDRDGFDAHAGNVVDYMRRHLADPRGPEDGEPGAALLERRKMGDVDSDEFARNEHYRMLYDWTMNEYAKHVVLFTACPRRLAARTDVADEGFEDWMEGRRSAAAPGSAALVRGQDIVRDMDSLVFYDRKGDLPDDCNVKGYCEFRSDGYFEAGTASGYTYLEGKERVLHLGHMTGDFRQFLEEVRAFYAKIGFDGPFDALVSIGNSSGLVLGNFGNEACRLDYYESREYKKMRGMFRRARRKNLQISRGFGGVQDLTDAKISDAARDMATKVAHAYGQKKARCFDESGNFAQKLWRTVRGERP